MLKENIIFNFETRYKLIDFLHTYINYENKKLMVVTAMDRYVQSFVRYSQTQDINEFIFPIYE